MNRRLLSPDLLKGFGIILVVIGHVLRGLEKSTSISVPESWEIIDSSIYLFHMPLFFFISGMFYEHSVDGEKFLSIVRKYSLFLLLPLVFWSYLQFSIQYVASSAVNSEITLSEVLSAPFPPKQQFWFLGTLFIYCISTFWVSKFKNKNILLIVLLLCFGILHAWLQYNPNPVLPVSYSWYLLQQSVCHFPFFLLGILLSSRMRHNINVPYQFGLILFFASIATFILFLGTGYAGLVSLLTSTICIISLFITIQGLEKSRHKKFTAIWAYIGKNSMGIYLAHIIFTAGIRTVLLKIGVIDAYTHLVIGVCVGVLFPLLAVYFAQKFPEKLQATIKMIYPYK